MHHANSAKYTIFMRRGASATPSEERGEILSTLVTIYYTLGVANVMQKKYPCRPMITMVGLDMRNQPSLVLRYKAYQVALKE